MQSGLGCSYALLLPAVNLYPQSAQGMAKHYYPTVLNILQQDLPKALK